MIETLRNINMIRLDVRKEDQEIYGFIADARDVVEVVLWDISDIASFDHKRLPVPAGRHDLNLGLTPYTIVQLAGIRVPMGFTQRTWLGMQGEQCDPLEMRDLCRRQL